MGWEATRDRQTGPNLEGGVSAQTKAGAERELGEGRSQAPRHLAFFRASAVIGSNFLEEKKRANGRMWMLLHLLKPSILSASF